MLHYGPLEGSKDGTAKVLSYLHNLPDYTWKEPDQLDPLSLVDQVRKYSIYERKVNMKAGPKTDDIKVVTFEIFFDDIMWITSNQVELSLAYGCSDSLGSEKLLQYVHRNRNHNYLRFSKIGE